MKKQKIMNAIRETGIVPVIRAETPEEAAILRKRSGRAVLKF